MPAHSIHMSDRIHTTFSLGLYLLVTPAPTTHLLSNTLGLPGSLTQHSPSYWLPHLATLPLSPRA